MSIVDIWFRSLSLSCPNLSITLIQKLYVRSLTLYELIHLARLSSNLVDRLYCIVYTLPQRFELFGTI
jgi:hypothetical protein